MTLASCATTVIAAVMVAVGLAQQPTTRGYGRSADTWCGDRWNDRRSSHCEVREATIPGGNLLDIDAGTNGGIRLRGWDRPDVLVRTKIQAYSDSEAEARRIVSGVRVDTQGGRVRAEGPDTDRDSNWSVSFEVQVPRNAHVTMNTNNGGISIDGFRGIAQFRARNGGVSLSDVGGDIRGETTNGGLTVDLSGDHWDGQGLDVETQNGGVRLTVPQHYSAELETGTTNGGMTIDFPVTVSGRLNRRLNVTLGSGGPRVRAITTNGGVTIRQR